MYSYSFWVCGRCLRGIPHVEFLLLKAFANSRVRGIKYNLYIYFRSEDSQNILGVLMDVIRCLFKVLDFALTMQLISICFCRFASISPSALHLLLNSRDEQDSVFFLGLPRISMKSSEANIIWKHLCSFLQVGA